MSNKTNPQSHWMSRHSSSNSNRLVLKPFNCSLIPIYAMCTCVLWIWTYCRSDIGCRPLSSKRLLSCKNRYTPARVLCSNWNAANIWPSTRNVQSKWNGTIHIIVQNNSHAHMQTQTVPVCASICLLLLSLSISFALSLFQCLLSLLFSSCNNRRKTN